MAKVPVRKPGRSAPSQGAGTTSTPARVAPAGRRQGPKAVRRRPPGGAAKRRWRGAEHCLDLEAEGAALVDLEALSSGDEPQVARVISVGHRALLRPKRSKKRHLSGEVISLDGEGEPDLYEQIFFGKKAATRGSSAVTSTSSSEGQRGGTPTSLFTPRSLLCPSSSPTSVPRAKRRPPVRRPMPPLEERPSSGSNGQQDTKLHPSITAPKSQKSASSVLAEKESQAPCSATEAREGAASSSPTQSIGSQAGPDLPQSFAVLLPEGEVVVGVTVGAQSSGSRDASAARTRSRVFLPEILEDTTPLPSLYAEKVRHSAAAESCRGCHQRFAVGQIRLGYVPQGCEEPGASDIRWLHAPRCLLGGLLRADAGSIVAFGPHIRADDRERILAVLGLVPPTATNQPMERTQPWFYRVAHQQKWERHQVLAPGAPRPPPSTPEARPALSENSIMARAVLARAGRYHRDLLARRRVRNIEAREVPRPRRGVDRQAPRASGVLREPREEPTVPEQLQRAAPVEKLTVTLGDTCVICRDHMRAGEEVRRLPCLHVFHSSCLERWMQVKTTCPLDNLTLDDMLATSRSIHK